MGKPKQEVVFGDVVVSVTGGGIVQPKNLLVPIGIPMGALIDFCGGLSKTAARMVAGGPQQYGPLAQIPGG